MPIDLARLVHLFARQCAVQASRAPAKFIQPIERKLTCAPAAFTRAHCSAGGALIRKINMHDRTNKQRASLCFPNPFLTRAHAFLRRSCGPSRSLSCCPALRRCQRLLDTSTLSSWASTPSRGPRPRASHSAEQSPRRQRVPQITSSSPTCQTTTPFIGSEPSGRIMTPRCHTSMWMGRSSAFCRTTRAAFSTSTASGSATSTSMRPTATALWLARIRAQSRASPGTPPIALPPRHLSANSQVRAYSS